MTLPLISIVTASFNQGQFLEECIDSVLGQNYPNLEYVIMDGGSTDNSVEIIKKYSRYLTYWQSRPDGGQYAAINEGFSRTSGGIMAWLNSDDKYHTGAFFKIAYVFDSHKEVEWITGRPTVFDKDGDIVLIFDYLPVFSREKYLTQGYADPHIQQESSFWRRSLWEKAGGMVRGDMEYAADMELWTRFFRHAPLYSLDAALGGYRYHGNQKAILNPEKYTGEADRIISEEIDRLEKGLSDEMLPSPDPIQIKFVELKNYLLAVNAEKFLAECRASYDLDIAARYFGGKIAALNPDINNAGHSPAADAPKGGANDNSGELTSDPELLALREKNNALEIKLELVNNEIDGMLSSRSWKLTGPLRFVSQILSLQKRRQSTGHISVNTDSESPSVPSVGSKSLSLFSDSELRKLAAHYKNYPVEPLSYATVRDFCDSFDHMRPLAELNGDLKDVQRPWTFKTLLALLPDSARVLEIGAGEPWTADMLSRLGHEVWICDPYDGTAKGPVEFEKYCEECPRIHFIRSVFGKGVIEAPPGYFDAIYSISVLEHVPAEQQTELFSAIRHYLKPTGYSVHSVDHVHKGNGADHHLRILRRINALSGNPDRALNDMMTALSNDVETYYLSAGGHNLWRGGAPYEQFPMRVCVSVQFCSPRGKIQK
jgi:glycosyltransferase involved in cell wall biosynthesis